MQETAGSKEINENLIAVKSFAFSLRIVEAYKVLQQKKEFVLSRQLLKSGTSIGANIQEALGAYSKRDFAAKLGIAYKEARESDYWVRLLLASGFITESEYTSLQLYLQEILRILGAILSTLRKSIYPRRR